MVSSMSNLVLSPQEDLSARAFESYSNGNFKACKEQLEALRQINDQGSGGGNNNSQKTSQVQRDEKETRVVQNQMLNEYYQGQASQPLKLLADLQKLAQSMVNIKGASECQISQDGQQIVMGDLTLSSTLQQAADSSSQTNQSVRSQASNSINSGNNKQQTSSSSAPQNSQTSQGQTTNQIFEQSMKPDGSLSNIQGEVNTVLLYNIAAISYQTQQYGQALAYLTELMKHFNNVEDFLQVKSLFLMLQVLYDLKKAEPALPIIFLLEVKFHDLDKIIKQKKQIKNSQSGSSHNSSSNFAEGGNTNTQSTLNNADNQDADDDNKSSFSEALDENVVTKNSFCILVGSYLRKHAVSPKNVNLKEYKMLLFAYKTLFKVLQKDFQGAQSELQQAYESKNGFSGDTVQFKAQIQKPAGQQHVSMLNNVKTHLLLFTGQSYRSAQNLLQAENNKEMISTTPHQSCQYTKQTDELSKTDLVYQKCKQIHPQYYFNNLGIVHLKLRKQRMAAFYFSKALKFLERSPNGELVNSLDGSPHEHINNMNSQKTSEILFNFGLALFKDKKYEQAFRNFEKSSHLLKANPKLWYYMGIAVLKLNQEKYQQYVVKNYQSDVFFQMLSFGEPQYLKRNNGAGNQFSRFQLTDSGDSLRKLTKIVSDHEQAYLDKLKQTQTEITKARSKTNNNSNQSKAQMKKQEKAAQQAWAINNLPKDSMSLEFSIMYLQNVLIAIQNEISNEINYSLQYKYMVRVHLMNLQQKHDEINMPAADGLSSNVNGKDNKEEDSKTSNKKDQSSSNADASQHVYPLPEFPVTQDTLAKYKKDIETKINKKYETLTKNVHLNLCYVFLMTYDYRNAIKHGTTLLNDFKISQKTEFTILQYLAEAYCMLGESQKAQDYLTKSAELTDGSTLNRETVFKIEQLANKRILQNDQIAQSTITIMNQTAVLLCNGDLQQARTKLDEILERLELKLVTTELDSRHMIPAYLTNLLVYFYLKTKNFKMARNLVKTRRFILDTNHLDNYTVPAPSSSAKGNIDAPIQSNNKQRQYRTISKSFT